MVVEIEAQRSGGALDEDDSTESGTLYARAGRTVARPTKNRAHEDAPNRCAELGIDRSSLAQPAFSSGPGARGVVSWGVSEPEDESWSAIAREISLR